MYLLLTLVIALCSFAWLDVPVVYVCDRLSLLKPICLSYTWLSEPILHLCISSAGFLFSRFSGRLKIFSFALLQYALSIGFIMFVCGILKLTVARARPHLLLREGLSGFAFGNLGHSFRSFPSSHIAVAVSLGILISLHFGVQWKWAVAGFVLLIALSRMILQMHFVSDLLIGVLVGDVVTKLVILLTNRASDLLAR